MVGQVALWAGSCRFVFEGQTFFLSLAKGESLTLKVSDCGLLAGTNRLRTSKNGEPRTVPMELEVQWQEHDLGAYPTLVLTWENSMRGAPWEYIEKCEEAFNRIRNRRTDCRPDAQALKLAFLVGFDSYGEERMGEGYGGTGREEKHLSS